MVRIEILGKCIGAAASSLPEAGSIFGVLTRWLAGWSGNLHYGIHRHLGVLTFAAEVSEPGVVNRRISRW